MSWRFFRTLMRQAIDCVLLAAIVGSLAIIGVQAWLDAFGVEPWR
ncbi:MAG: hypothetical protein NXI21_01865 [Alphaproteobacteria bacterium]|nr:hypothetical protein [Alphaproteobacteria bacterium]